MSTIAETIAAAKAAALLAANNPSPPTGDVQQTTSTAVATAPAGRRSLRQAAEAQGAVVDSYLKVTPDGFKISSNAALLTGDAAEIAVFIDFAQVVPTSNVRGEAPGGVVLYGRTVDGVTDSSGKPWGQVVNSIMQRSVADKFVEYESFEIPMQLEKNAARGKGEEALKAGATIGFTPSMMQAKEFLKFFNSLPGNIETQGPQRVVLGHETRKGAGPSYGVITFTHAPA